MDKNTTTPNNVVQFTASAPDTSTTPVITKEFKERTRGLSKEDQYLVAEKAIRSGHKASWASIKELGIGSDFSQEFLKRLRDNNIIKRYKRGHKLASK